MIRSLVGRWIVLIGLVAANPGAFGLSNVTTPCYSGFVEPNPAATECANPDQFLFWDIVHPTTGVHAILADAVIAAIPEPSTLRLVLLGLLFVAGGIRLSRRTATREFSQ